MQTKAEYDLIADQWCSIRTELPSNDVELFELFLSYLPDNSHVLDLGCGHGTPVADLISSHGHNILGIDRSEKLLSIAKSKFPQHSWQQSDLEKYQPNQQFDGIVIWDSMFHLPRQEHAILLNKAYQSLKYKGALILSSGGSKYDIPPFTGSMFNNEFFYDSFTIKQLLDVCEEIGLRVVQTKLVNEPDGGRDKGRLGVVLRKI
ncbi:hypothetical protein MACH09_15290 [Vibrio sp. MACH09]|uniref:class I SAM-dependent methyltransferase n=1 Tax=Vibrio sp. MACH09 TaxID=3025122 RepID=UPI00278CA6E0|nr:class I SAM-dependent methyltransferase [Vibrio sp. MACH09]GLO61021.1 hypothetical protein MACH09_15290 [Vibrio sp. MACH09]